MKLCKLLLAVVGATVLLGALVSTASAGRLSSSTQAFTGKWTSAEFGGGFGTVRCNLTLEGSLHSRTINKTPELLIGFVTRGSVGPCASGSATILQASFPWHVRYAGFSGTLPSIGSILTHVIGSGFEIREPSLGATCLALSTATSPSTGTYTLSSGSVTSVTLGGSIGCTGAISVVGTLRASSTSNSAQTITLI